MVYLVRFVVRPGIMGFYGFYPIALVVYSQINAKFVVRKISIDCMDIQEIKQRFSIIGNAPGLNRAIEVALQVAPTDLSVLISGESCLLYTSPSPRDRQFAYLIQEKSSAICYFKIAFSVV